MNSADLLADAVRRSFVDIGEFGAEPLRAAKSNRSWRVSHADGSFIAKFPERRGGLTITPQQEFEIMRLGADAGIAPLPLAHDAATDIFFAQELTDAQVLSEAEFRKPERIALVGHTLRSLHGAIAPPQLRRFEPITYAQTYFSHLSETARDEAISLCQLCEHLTNKVEHLLSGNHICHNDLHAGNILFADRAWLIDFEYAVQAAPVVDVAACIASNTLDEETAIALAKIALGTELHCSAEELFDIAGIHLSLAALWKIARSDNNAAG